MRLKSMKNEYLGRWVLTTSGVVEGHLVVSADQVEEICYGKAPAESSKALVLPGLVNAHTHVADSVAFPAPKGCVEELVAPPDGYKHRILRDTPAAKKRDAMCSAIETMLRTGTTTFIDFREEGIEGIQTLVDSIPSPSPRAVILGRPLSSDIDNSEIDRLLERSDGIGMSSVRDWPLDFLGRLSRRAKAKKKLFAIHASESVREDMDAILGLAPDFVVHMTKASEEEILACAQRKIPIVVCPRANAFYGLAPNIPMMLRLGATVALGTDNGMISEPNMLDELKAAFKVGKRMGDITPIEAASLATFGGRKVLNQMGKILTKASPGDDLAVVRVKGEDPLLELVTSTRSQDVMAVVKGGKIWRAESWKR